MQVANFEKNKRKKERGIDCDGILKIELDTVENTDSIVIVTLTKDKQINVSYSRNGSLETLGMLEVAKAILLEEMN